MIDLDHNATTRPSDAVIQAVARGMAERWHNPSSVHRAGQDARREVELARAAVAELIHAKPRDITFTSGGTEAIDLALRGALAAYPGRTLITTRVEHSAVRELAEDLAKDPALTSSKIEWAPVGADGLVDASALAAIIARGPAIVSIQWANNETGAIQPVEEIARACRSHAAIFHCDATQWVGKEPTSVSGGPGAIDCSLLTFSPHKFHGPKGVGVLWAAPGVRLRPRLIGTQELGRRGGTENVPGIIGAGVAAREAVAWLDDPTHRRRQASLRDQFEALVLEALPGSVVNGPRDRRLWNTTNIGFPRLEAEALLIALSERGVLASAGAACSSGSLDPSPVLLAMGVPPHIAHGSLRFSLGRDTTEEQITRAAAIVADVVRTLSRHLTVA